METNPVHKTNRPHRESARIPERDGSSGKDALPRMLAERLSAVATEAKDICIGLQPVAGEGQRVDSYQVVYSNQSDGGFCKFKGSRVPRLGFLAGQDVIDFLREKAKRQPPKPVEAGGVPAPLAELPSASDQERIEEFREIPGSFAKATEWVEKRP